MSGCVTLNREGYNQGYNDSTLYSIVIGKGTNRGTMTLLYTVLS